jgi:hypothetical protein
MSNVAPNFSSGDLATIPLSAIGTVVGVHHVNLFEALLLSVGTVKRPSETA